MSSIPYIADVARTNIRGCFERVKCFVGVPRAAERDILYGWVGCAVFDLEKKNDILNKEGSTLWLYMLNIEQTNNQAIYTARLC